MVWGAIGVDGVGSLHRCVGTLNQHKYIEMLEQYRDYFHDTILVQDNAPSHSTLNVRNWLHHHNISTLCIPPLSPDLNPIENVWRIMKHRIQGKRFTSIDELWNELQIQWNTIPLSYLETLFISMPHRVNQIVRHNGGPTHY